MATFAASSPRPTNLKSLHRIKLPLLLSTFLAGLLPLCADIAASTTNDAPVATETNDVEVPLAKVPAAVQKTLESQLNGRTVSDIERVTEHGEISYDIETTTPDGDEREITIAQDGTLLTVETALGETPAAVQRAVTATVGPGVLEGIDKTFDEGETTYTADITRDARERNFTFKADGTLISEEMAMADLPAAVQDSITATVGQGQLGEIDKMFEVGEITYDATIFAPGGPAHDFTFKADGTLASEKVEMADLPPAVQTAITAALGQGRLERIDKTFDNGAVTYDAIIATNGPARDFAFKEDGTLSSEEVGIADLSPAAQSAVLNEVGQGRIVEIDRTVDDGETDYEIARISPDGHERDFTIADDGELLSRELLLEETPPAVQKTVAHLIGDGKVLHVDQSLGQLKHSYHVEVQKDGKIVNLKIGVNGKFLGAAVPTN